MRTIVNGPVVALAAVFALAACDDRQMVTASGDAVGESRGQAHGTMLPGHLAGPFSDLGGAVFAITAAPNGNLLVPVTELGVGGAFVGNTVKEIGPHGTAELTSIPAPGGSPINGIEAIGQGAFFATSGGQDLAVGAGLWRVSRGNARLVADIEAYTLGGWPDGEPGPYPDDWKEFVCELYAAFTPGPQTNPYQLTALSGGEVLMGDAAGNGVLVTGTNGRVDWVAHVEPPVDENGDWIVLAPIESEDRVVDCYVEPVPTSVAVGSDGDYYVGELTGTTPENLVGLASPQGLARVWRITKGARNVNCPSAACVEVVSGLNAVVDIAFGPDGLLYVVEFDRDGYFKAAILGEPAGGALKRCDVATGACEVLMGNDEFLLFPSALTFDKWGTLWLVENVFAPTVRQVGWR